MIGVKLNRKNLNNILLFIKSYYSSINLKVGLSQNKKRIYL
jgi:hypothetical protein